MSELATYLPYVPMEVLMVMGTILGWGSAPGKGEKDIISG